MVEEERQTEITQAALGLSLVNAQGLHWVLPLIGRLKSTVAVWTATPATLMGLGMSSARVHRFVALRDSMDETIMKSLAPAPGTLFIPYESRSFPALLRELYNPPAGLFVAGRVNHWDTFLSQVRAVVVGTRKATEYGLIVTGKVVERLAAAGFAVVSGLALGIDTAAHSGALRAGGFTAAVLGCGIDVPYPRRNRQLRARVVEEGLFISEFPKGVHPASWTFPLRNRIMAGLAHGVIVVEAGVRSGALITVEHALELGRDVYGVPGSVLSESSVGVNRMIADGASPAVDLTEMVEEFSSTARIEMGRPPVRPGLPRDNMRRDAQPQGNGAEAVENLAYQVLCRGPASVDDVAGAAGVEVAEAARSLAMLELRGAVRRVGPGRFAAST